MTTTKIFKAAGLKVGSTLLAHNQEHTVDNQIDDITVYAAGDWAPNFTGGREWAPEFEVPTMDLQTALDLMTINTICRDASAETVKILERAIQKAGMQYGESVAQHVTYQMVNGAMLYWDSIRSNQGDECQITVRACAFYNGTNDPLAQVNSETIDTAPGETGVFCLGPLVVNGTAIKGCKNLTIALNPEVQKESDSGEASPSFVAIHQVRPVIQFESTDLDSLYALGTYGAAVTSWTQWFRRRKVAQLLWANNQSKHAKLYHAGSGGNTVGRLVWKQISGTPAMARCEIHLQRPSSGVALFSYAKDQQIT